MKAKRVFIVSLVVFLSAFLFLSCNQKDKRKTEDVIQYGQELSEEDLLDSVQYRTFLYFWDAAEPTSGMARERYHMDGEYGKHNPNTVTSGGSGFGIMAIIAGMEREFITRQQGIQRMNQILSFLEKSDSFHGVFPHWWNGETGEVVGFSDKDNGGDLVETSFLIQGLLAAHQYFVNGSEEEQSLASRIDNLWRSVEWNWHSKDEEVLYWHWSPEHSWEMNFAIRGFNECLITYILAVSSPTYAVSTDVYHKGWAENGNIVSPHVVENQHLNMRYQSNTGAGPLFWAHYSFLGLNPNGLSDKYADYFQEMKNYTLLNRAYCIRNPKGYKGYNEYSWGLSASYSVDGYSAHHPAEDGDLGVITPTAALSSIVYTPKESLAVMRYLYTKGDVMFGSYGFYDAYSETKNWYPQRYLAIDQGPICVMIENYRTGLLWNLFMSHPDVKKGLDSLEFKYKRD